MIVSGLPRTVETAQRLLAETGQQIELDIEPAWQEIRGGKLSNIPPQDIKLIAPTAELLARDDLHPALSDLLIEAAKEVHDKASVLQKAGRLTNEEFALIQQHPTIGRRILEGVQGFEDYLPIVELHHENWDGSGYPLGLRGESVPLCARIVHVADVYDAITSDRPYRRGMDTEQALRLIEDSVGKQFDPSIVRVFMDLPEIRDRHLVPAYADEIGFRQLSEAISRGGVQAFQVSMEKQT